MKRELDIKRVVCATDSSYQSIRQHQVERRTC